MISALTEMRVESPAREMLAAKYKRENQWGYFNRFPQGENIKEINQMVNKILYGTRGNKNEF